MFDSQTLSTLRVPSYIAIKKTPMNAVQFKVQALSDNKLDLNRVSLSTFFIIQINENILKSNALI